MKRTVNPWWVVLGAAVAQIMGQGPITQFTIGVFLKPITKDFGWSRGGASVALTLSLALTAFSVPVAGRLMDRFGVKPVALIAATLFGLGLMAVGLFARSPLSFVICYALVGIVATGQTPLAYNKTLAGLFDRRRGLAFALALTGVGIGTIVAPQIAQRLIDALGWRGGYVGLGALVLIVALPILAFLVGPAAVHRRFVDIEPTAGLTTGQALRDPKFYMLAGALFLGAAAANGTIAHVAPLLTDRGVPTAVAVGALSLVGFASIAGRIFAGYVLDRLPGGIVAGLFLCAAAAGIVLLALSSSTGAAMGAVILLGLGLGAEADLVGYMVTRYFGTRSFGELFGYMFGTFLLASSIGPALMGLWYDRAGSYVPCLFAFAGALVVAAALFQTLGAYVYAPPKEDVVL